MKAAVLSKGSVHIEEVALPALEEGHARIKLMHVGLCGSDMHRFDAQRESDQNVILGHEFVGRVVEINGIQDSVQLQVNDAVAGCPVLPCGECGNCSHDSDNLCEGFHAIGRDSRGAFAEYVDAPISSVFRLPDQEHTKKFVLADVVAVCLHAADDIAGNIAGKKCLIIGDGAIGACLALVLKARGADGVAVASRHQDNFDLINRVSSADKLADDPDDFDLVFETVGRTQLETLELSLSRVATRGKIIVLGVFPPGFELKFDNRKLFLKEASLTASVAYKASYFAAALAFIHEHPEIEELITQEYPFESFDEGLKTMRDKAAANEAVVKVVYNL
ncbi:alcohol dehydrogenase catalytic domain-containing protein [Candidatus Peregrinibacteria bacterium]|nr:alcohol dehydrogenase catalytic domain-containing protein [Candidatus Peregrinibacteria bacterium]